MNKEQYNKALATFDRADVSDLLARVQASTGVGDIAAVRAAFESVAGTMAAMVLWSEATREGVKRTPEALFIYQAAGDIVVDTFRSLTDSCSCGRSCDH